MKGRTGFGEDLELVERMLERIWKGFGEDFGEGFVANAARPTSTIKLLA